MSVYTKMIYTGEDHSENWIYNRYYYGGGNSRYYTFQLALNLLIQQHQNATIIETGCQRQEEDVGAGMSTSLFAEFIYRYGGKLISVDLVEEHLRRAKEYVKRWEKADITFVSSDSVAYLKGCEEDCSLLYLDSLDYPVGRDQGNIQMQKQAQEHCLQEFLAIEHKLKNKTLLLIDDNQLEGGGKPAKLKLYLAAKKEWTCLLDLQGSLWIKGAK